MNRAKAKRWLNEYLDGEIGLADKAEFERMMAQDPELRKEYDELRRIGMMMSSGPEIEVHPTEFRARLMERIVPQQRFTLTPQRAFAGSMLVALLVVTISFGQFIYSRAVENGTGTITVANPSSTSQSSLRINTSASHFLNDTLLRAESTGSMTSMRLVEQLDRQLGLYEGAVCTEKAGSRSYLFPGGLPQEISLRLDGPSLLEVEAIAGRYPGSGIPLVELSDGSRVSLSDYSSNHPLGRVDLRISFSQP